MSRDLRLGTLAHLAGKVRITFVKQHYLSTFVASVLLATMGATAIAAPRIPIENHNTVCVTFELTLLSTAEKPRIGDRIPRSYSVPPRSSRTWDFVPGSYQARVYAHATASCSSPRTKMVGDMNPNVPNQEIPYVLLFTESGHVAMRFPNGSVVVWP